MSLDLAPLVDRVYDYFLDLYRGQAGAGAQIDDAAPGEPFLAFAKIGSPITPDMFLLADGTPFPPLVTEQFSLVANLLPELEGGTIGTNGILTADGAYAAMLAQAQPLTPADAAALGAIRGQAEQIFDQAEEQPRIHGGVEYRPALPLPPDFPLASGEAAWTSYSQKVSQTETVAAPPPRRPGPRPAAEPWRWRVAPPELRGTVRSLSAVAALIAPKPAGPPRSAATNAMLALRPAALAAAVPAARLAMAARVPAVAPVADRPAIALSPDRAELLQAIRRPPVMRDSPPILAEVVRAEILQRKLQQVREESQPQAVTSSSMEISFRYCLVSARRPWLSTAFLTARNWYIPRLRAGEIASGTGSGDGYFEVLPAAALCVRDLTIRAAWSAEERAVLPEMVKFGPFSLVGSRVEGQEVALVCPGMQIIGWVMTPMPMLPPNGDPALPPGPA